MKYHRITTIAGLALGTAAPTATAANAVTYNPDGTGFIGKGEVQSAFGMNNPGTRAGSLNGTLNGTLNASIDAQARKTGQWTGWNVKGFTVPAKFTGTCDPQFPVVESLSGDYDFGSWSFEGSTWEPSGTFGNFGDHDLGNYEWSGVTWATDDYVAAPGNNDPDGVCKDGASNVVPGSVKLVTTYGEIHENDPEFGSVVSGDITANADVTPGDIHDGAVIPGAVTNGAETPTGVVKTFATYNSITKQIG